MLVEHCDVTISAVPDASWRLLQWEGLLLLRPHLRLPLGFKH